MTPRQGTPDWDAAHARAKANIQRIVEREQRKGETKDEPKTQQVRREADHDQQYPL
jgi:hypothetical protein